jgi:hypothetical protein
MDMTLKEKRRYEVDVKSNESDEKRGCSEVNTKQQDEISFDYFTQLNRL